jgi:hypothetical protein
MQLCSHACLHFGAVAVCLQQQGQVSTRTCVTLSCNADMYTVQLVQLQPTTATVLTLSTV